MSAAAILSAIVAVLGVLSSIVHYFDTKTATQAAANATAAKVNADALSLETAMAADVTASTDGAAKLLDGTF